MMMRCHEWLHVMHSIAHRKKVQPPRGLHPSHLAPQGSLLSSATPGYQEYNPDGVAVSSTIDHRTTTRGWCASWHLSSCHNMECDHTIPWGCTPHGHSLPNHGIRMVSNMGIYHHTTTWDCAPHGRSLPSHAIEIVRIIAIYHHIITRRMIIPFPWDCVPHGHLSPHHNMECDHTTT